jgi:hypothetical protein
MVDKCQVLTVANIQHDVNSGRLALYLDFVHVRTLGVREAVGGRSCTNY